MATFAVDHALYGLDPFGYGITNLAICSIDAALIFILVRRLSLPTAAAVVASATWVFNFHGINMTLLWLSGRTALLVVLFALATAIALLRGRTMAAGALCLCALLCKEEAVTLPVLWTVFTYADGRRTGLFQRGAGMSLVGWELASRTWPLWLALGAYAVLRSQSGAFNAWNAPDYYRLYTSLTLLVRNVLEYADRSGTVFAAIILICLAAAGRRAQAFSDAERRALLLAAIWIPATFVLTVSLPSRSDVYVPLPAAGSALAAAAVASRTIRAHPCAFRRTAAALVLLAVLLIPVYRARNVRWVKDAELSSTVVDIVRTAAARYQSGGRMLFVENPAVRPNFESAFVSMLPEVLNLFAGSGWTSEVVQSLPEPFPDGTIVVGLRGGRATVLAWPD
jgi:hypothetical protein